MKTMVDFKLCDVTNWATNSYNTNIAKYLKTTIFPEKSYTKYDREASLRSLYKILKLSLSLDQQSEIL